jgi:ectoine hydroxylase-related dioxygenase (phytanoyl-CoA dioxygenase family)
MTDHDIAARRREFHDDGVTVIRGALSRDGLALARAAFDWSIANPGPAASRPFDGIDGAFYQDLCNPAASRTPAYDHVLRATPIAPLVTALWDDPQIWFMYEQVFLKEGGENRRTPWHQDASYLNVDGDHLAVVWITFEHVAQQDCLEFVRGSHRGTLYNTSAFNPDDATIPIFDGLPRLPDIEADRGAFDIVSWSVVPGDLVVFHPAMLHGGAPTQPGQRRSTLSLRFFGRDAVYAQRPGGRMGPRVDGLHERIEPGAPFRADAFPELTATA